MLQISRVLISRVADLLCCGSPVFWSPVFWSPVFWSPVFWSPVLRMRISRVLISRVLISCVADLPCCGSARPWCADFLVCKGIISRYQYRLNVSRIAFFIQAYIVLKEHLALSISYDCPFTDKFRRKLTFKLVTSCETSFCDKLESKFQWCGSARVIIQIRILDEFFLLKDFLL